MKSSYQLRRRFIPCYCVLLLLTAGCGSEAYNNRLAATNQLFQYTNKLKENLGSAWIQSGVEIRMPTQLLEVPPPPMVKNDEGEWVQDGEDERIPPELPSLELPGLIGAWKGDVEADVSGEFKTLPAYAFIMSNGYLWAENNAEEAMEYSNIIAEKVVDGLNLPLYDPSDWKQKQYPATPGFVPQQGASVWVTQTDIFVGETKAEISLHLFGAGDTTVYVLFIYPETISSGERFAERIDLALETLKISADKPVAGSTTAPGTAPTKSSGGF